MSATETAPAEAPAPQTTATATPPAETAPAAPKTLAEYEAEAAVYNSTPITSAALVASILWANVDSLPDARLIDREALKPLVEKWSQDLVGASPKHIREILAARLSRSNPASSHVFSRPDPLAPPAELPPFVPQTLGQQWLMEHYENRDKNRPVWLRSVTPQAEFESMVQQQREAAAREAAGYQPPPPPPAPPAPEGPQTLGQVWLAEHQARQGQAPAAGYNPNRPLWRQNR